MRKHRLYDVWANMLQRTTNPKRHDYKYYGGRGIKVCDSWLVFENFNADMLPTFEEGLTLDREDVNGDYCKENCRWASVAVQNKNKRTYANSPTQKSGVSPHKGRWRARAFDGGKTVSLGVHATIEAAHAAVDNYWKRVDTQCPSRNSP